MYFSRIPRFPTRTPTRAIPTATVDNSRSASSGDGRIGLIAGTAVGGVIVLIVLLIITLLLLHRKKTQKRMASPSRPVELPASGTTNLMPEQYSPEPKDPIAEQLSITPGHIYSPSTTQTGSPETSPRGPSPGAHTHMSESNVTPSPLYRTPTGVYPLGPYYAFEGQQQQQTTVGAEQPTTYHEMDGDPSPNPALQHQQQPPERPGPAPSLSNYSETEPDQRQSMTKTPLSYYPQPLNVAKQGSREELDIPSKSAARAERSLRSARSGFAVE